MKTFEDLIAALFNMYAALIAHKIPPTLAQQANWSTPDQLDWLAIGWEQDSFYLNFACGEYQGEYGSVRGALLPLKECIETEEYWVPESRTYQNRIIALLDAKAPENLIWENDILDMARYDILDWDGLDFEDEDENDIDQDRDELSQFLLQSALAVVLLRLERELITELPIQKSEPLELTVFDDVESSTFNIAIPAFDGMVLDKAGLIKLIPEISTVSSNQEFLRMILENNFSGTDIIGAVRAHYKS